jgi:glycosyltransferase EpsF
MKRILHIIGSMDRAGAETMVMNLYRVLDRNEYQFDFLYFTEKKCDFDDEIEALGGRVFRVSNKGFINRFTSTFEFLKKNKGFYAIHSHTLLNNGTNLFAAYLAGHKKRVSHSHNTSNGSKTLFLSRLYYQFSKYLINTFANGYIACGNDAGKYLYYGKNKFLFLPNAVNFEDFNNLGSAIRAEFGIESNSLLICQIGRFLEVKNHMFTIELARYMASKNIDFKILLVGDGLLKEHMIGKVEEYEVDDKVIFLGLRKDIPNILKAADCMIMPSLHEGFPVVLVEAQAAGTPSLISSTIAGQVDLGVDLIHFESLSSHYKIWYEKLREIKMLKKQDDLFLENLKNQGFDISSSLNILLKYYQHV